MIKHYGLTGRLHLVEKILEIELANHRNLYFSKRYVSCMSCQSSRVLFMANLAKN